MNRFASAKSLVAAALALGAVAATTAAHARTDAVHATCGQRWPRREMQAFRNTYVEHWRRD